MSILDDAIREHLELKRAHGADEGEVQRLEDEAFGPPQRPDEIDPFAEAPTEFLRSPEETAAEVPEIADEHERSGRRPNLTDLQEGPPPAPAEDLDDEEPSGAVWPGGLVSEPGADEPADADDGPEPRLDDDAAAPPEERAPTFDAPPPRPADAAAAPPPPPADAVPVDLEPPVTDEHPAGEHKIVPAPDPTPSPDADPEANAAADADPDADPAAEASERRAIVDQPTQLFDVQAQMDAEAAAAAEQASPTDEELVDAAREEPHAAPPAPEEPPLADRVLDAEIAGHPPAEPAPEEESAEFDFFNEQRLSEELDQALEAPVTDERALPEYEDAPPGEGGIFDFEAEREPYEEDPSQEVLRRADAAEEAPPEPPSEEAHELPEPPSEEAHELPEPPSEETPRDAAAPEDEGDDDDYDYDPETGHDDVLEDTPSFLEGQPEDDDLWFEQKPPKDFDLD